jgi:site-specific recombinase XerD
MFFTQVALPPDQITVNDIEKYILYIKTERKNSINTQKLKQAVIRLFFVWHSTKYHMENPAEGLRPIQEDIKIPSMPDRNEVARMVKACDESTFIGRRNAAIICLLADTGIRLGECSVLNVANIEISLDGANKNFLLSVPRIKSRGRKIPFGDLTAGLLVGEVFSTYYLEITLDLKYGRDSPLFLKHGQRYDNERLQYTGIRQMIKRTARRAGIKKKIGPHSFRHFFGTYTTMNGMDIRYLKKLMGHAWLETTERYIHISSIVSGQNLKQYPMSGTMAQNHQKGLSEIVKKGLASQSRGQ